MNTRLHKTIIHLKGSSITKENPLPFFRDPQHDIPVRATQGFPKELMHSFGRETAFRMLPYRRQDGYSREVELLDLEALVLENDFLRAEFIPSMGGRLWSLFDKVKNKEMLYKNPVFRPANLAIRDAWFSGGIEWNIGRFGHGVHTCSPVFAGAFTNTEGNPILRIWEFERQTRLYWSIDFMLPSDSPILFAYFRVTNFDDETKPLYWWTNIAAHETPGVRILAATDQVLYLVPNGGYEGESMGSGTLPNLPSSLGNDSSYPGRIDFSNEYFFQSINATYKDQLFPWEAAVYEDGYTFFECSTPPLSYRKMFCWGTGRGGQKWQDFLSLPGERYLEIQSGLAPTQLHTTNILGGEAIDWVQGFGSMSIKASEAHTPRYHEAISYMQGSIANLVTPSVLNEQLRSARSYHAVEPVTLYNLGTGWGALEAKLSKKIHKNGTPQGLLFPDESIGHDEAPWQEILDSGFLPHRDPQDSPGAFVTDSVWNEVLTLAHDRLKTLPKDAKNWLVPYHLGVQRYENGDKIFAVKLWKESIEIEPNAWSWRNIAVAASEEGNINEALQCYERVYELLEDKNVTAFMEEYIPFLLNNGFLDKASKLLKSQLQKDPFPHGALLNAAVKIALEEEDDVLFDKLISREPVNIREGDNTLSDYWFEREARRLSKNEKITLENAREKIKEQANALQLSPPISIDFRKSIGI